VKSHFWEDGGGRGWPRSDLYEHRRPHRFGCTWLIFIGLFQKFENVFYISPWIQNRCLGCHLLSVRKVVPTLTIKSAEIYLSLAGAKQLVDTGFILVPAGAVRPAVVCSRHCIALHRGACRGGLQARRERRPGLQVPEVF
jgi:hypothetical protein